MHDRRTLKGDPMDRLAYLRDLEEQRGIGAFDPLFDAFLSCLSASEACGFLDLEFDQDFCVRQKIVTRIRDDMRADFGDCHKELLATLAALLPVLTRKKATPCAFCLEQLFEGCDLEMREMIVQLLMNSRYKDMRNRAYRILREHWDNRWEPQVETAWAAFREPSCAVLAVERMPTWFLGDNFDELFAALPSFWPFGKLFGRLAEVKPEHWNRLRQKDGVTYAYVHAKMGLRIEAAEAIRLYEENKGHESVGLLVWSIGKMRLWEALVHIEADTSRNLRVLERA